MKQREYLDAIRKLQFFALDLNLYLDNFPDCKEATDDFKLISSKLKKLVWDYEQEYGPLTNFGSACIQMHGLIHHGLGKKKLIGRINLCGIMLKLYSILLI